MAHRNYTECGLCKGSIGENLKFGKREFVLNSDGYPICWCNLGFENPNYVVKLNNGNETKLTPWVHYVCCLLRCEKNHYYPCNHRFYRSKSLETIIIENEKLLLENQANIKNFI